MSACDNLSSWLSRLWPTWPKGRRSHPLCHNQVLMNLYNGQSHQALTAISAPRKLKTTQVEQWRLLNANLWCSLLSTWHKVFMIDYSCALKGNCLVLPVQWSIIFIPHVNCQEKLHLDLWPLFPPHGLLLTTAQTICCLDCRSSIWLW